MSRFVAAAIWTAFILGQDISVGHTNPPAAFRATVEVEEDVYTYEPANNGSGPLWCSGSTCLVRIGDTVLASGVETLENQQPLNNCRWTLYKRGKGGWELQQSDPAGRTREPSPVAGFPDGRLFLSVNPTLTDSKATSGPARPEILEFQAEEPTAPFQKILPQWQGEPPFSEHSYRSFAADGPNRELILFQNVGYTHAEWTFRDKKGKWSANGQLTWPWGKDYEKPEPIRVCYPCVMLKDRSVHFLGVSDIIEPNSKWRAYKKQLTGRNWDYDFRRLFYCWTPDITKSGFRTWVEIASRESTCGRVMPGDLYVQDDGTVHLLWTERAIDTRLREKFFPAERQSHSLNYATIQRGSVVSKRILAVAGEEGPQEIPHTGRFHVTPDHRLFVVYYVSGASKKGDLVSANRIMELLPDGSSGASVRLPLKTPFSSFFTATPRAGSPLSETIDLLGEQTGKSRTVSYARIRLTLSKK